MLCNAKHFKLSVYFFPIDFEKITILQTMNKQELISRIGDLEWEDWEVKAARGEVPKSSWETVSAMADY